MKIKSNRILGIELLIVLLIINYMIVTIILKDNIVFKFSRDILVLFLAGITISKIRPQFKYSSLMICLFVLVCIAGLVRSESLSLGIVVIRKYYFPLLVLYVMCNIKASQNMQHFTKFLLIFFAIMSLWGIFQAHVLGDEFLKNLGYPTQYSYGYKREMLNNSYYFGGFGIQRVVMTLSNSNVCALILGATLLYLIICYPYLKNVKFRNIYIVIIGIAYVLTFSRSNFLALAIVIVLSVWPYVPYKKFVTLGLGVLGAAIIVYGIIQGEDGIVYQLFEWIQRTLSFTEDSAAGRSSRWLTALAAVLKNPMGIGFGHVGSLAWEAGVVNEYYSCENSYLALALDTGWPGFVLYYGFLVCTLIKLKKYTKKFKNSGNHLSERLCSSASAILMYFFVVIFFSNHIYDMEAMAMIYIYVGMALSVCKESKVKINRLSQSC